MKIVLHLKGIIDYACLSRTWQCALESISVGHWQWRVPRVPRTNRTGISCGLTSGYCNMASGKWWRWPFQEETLVRSTPGSHFKVIEYGQLIVWWKLTKQIEQMFTISPNGSPKIYTILIDHRLLGLAFGHLTTWRSLWAMAFGPKSLVDPISCVSNQVPIKGWPGAFTTPYDIVRTKVNHHLPYVSP